VLKVGDTIPDVPVWIGTRERVSLRDLAADGPVLVLTFLFAWSST
jgi:peroxiredoxin